MYLIDSKINFGKCRQHLVGEHVFGIFIATVAVRSSPARLETITLTPSDFSVLYIWIIITANFLALPTKVRLLQYRLAEMVRNVMYHVFIAFHLSSDKIIKVFVDRKLLKLIINRDYCCVKLINAHTGYVLTTCPT